MNYPYIIDRVWHVQLSTYSFITGGKICLIVYIMLCYKTYIKIFLYTGASYSLWACTSLNI